MLKQIHIIHEMIDILKYCSIIPTDCLFFHIWNWISADKVHQNSSHAPLSRLGGDKHFKAGSPDMDRPTVTGYVNC